MIKKLLFFVLFISLSSLILFGQSSDSAIVKKVTPKQNFFPPSIGLGIGMFKFYGDVLQVKRGNALISNIGYDLHVKQQLNSYLTAKFYILFGTLSSNERSAERNLNFKSEIRTGGFALLYNFNQLLPKERIINPFISLGIESVEFHSKTDLLDEYGNKYNYWSDGSIRNLSEDDPNAMDAIIIQRDYTYETDLREMNLDNKGKYPERTFAIPLGIGAQMHLSKNIDFTVGTTLHFTFSDLIDNVTGESSGERIGTLKANNRNDRFLMSSIALSYNFQNHNKKDQVNGFDESIDYMAFDDGDEDADGVIDFIDECPWTPTGVPVDEKGCPLDVDKDFVPNYKDDELESRPEVPVSPNGVELTDEMIYEAYLKYIDSSLFAATSNKIISADVRPKKNYRVQIGAFTEAIDAELVDKFLSIPDVEIKTFGDSLTIIAVGNYDNLPEALKRKIQMIKQGFDAAIVVTEEKDGTLKSVGDEANNMAVENSGGLENSNELLFRVQLGAYSKKLPPNSFNGLKNIIEIKADDGLYKYLYNGSYKSMKEAASKKLDLAIDYGVKDAFVVAYKGGKRIPLNSAGVITTQTETDIKEYKSKSYTKENIKFKIQVGIYKNQLPTEVLTKFIEIGNIEQKTVENGLTRYTAGDFKTLEDAEKFKQELLNKGLGGSFVISLYNDELIPLSKAKEIIEQ